MRPPPTSPLFPYTTLFRSSTDLAGFTVGAGGLTVTPTGAAPLDVYAFGRRIDPAGGFVTNSQFFGEVRFEPGTADRKSTRLNSTLAYLVCRLLLEKKKPVT